MTTKIPAELSSTPGISDSSNATAITINSSENVTVENNLFIEPVDSGKLYFTSSSGFSPRIEGDSTALTLKTNNSERMRIANDGKIGIGTSSPAVMLDVRGEVAIDYNATYGLRFYNQSRNNWSSIGNTDTSTGANMVFKSGGGEALRILHNGNIGINNSSPANKLDVNGTVQFSSAYGTGTALIINNTNADNNYTPIGFRDNGTTVGYIFVNGSLNQTSYVTSSDYRLKENINYSWNATEKLKQLKPAEFNMISDEENTVLSGFLAHEVENILPQAVNGIKDAVDEEGNPKYQGIDHSKLVPLLTKAIQEQQDIIEDLKSRIETLEG